MPSPSLPSAPFSPSPAVCGPDAQFQPFPDVSATSPFCPDVAWAIATSITSGYTDLTFRPGLPVARQQMASFLFRLTEAAPAPPGCATDPFDDVPSASLFCGAIAWLVASGVADGFVDGTFRPTTPITRGQLATFLHRLAEPDTPTTTCDAAPFTDVDADHPFCGDIAWLVDAGLAAGFSDGTYGPAEPVTRGQMVAFLHRFADRDV